MLACKSSGFKVTIFYLSTTACTVLTTTPQGNYGNYNITIRRPDVHVTCVNDTTIAGSSNVTCKNDGWIPKFPHCLVNCPPIPERPDITTIDTIYYVEQMFNIPQDKYLKLVLEEDGSEIQTTPSMVLCQKKVLMVIDRNDKWKPVSSDESEKIRLTYDVCSFDRKQRKLFLANSLKDLIDQVQHIFEQEDNYLCLEIDGTVIDDDISLTAVTGQQLMSMNETTGWLPVTSGEITESLSELKTDEHSNDKK
ncbi:unnamed protein product [Mytilus edulis]|uniref:CIDE-N domain-containing protein n=1 Tax=Mytilus edulis TaxID=6550 RepID=A0A8S3T4N8_MYTED|nr:unnamed protein product [Mytilus edulis]